MIKSLKMPCVQYNSTTLHISKSQMNDKDSKLGGDCKITVT